MNKMTQFTDTSELDVLLTLKKNIFKNLKVGSFGQIKSIDNDEQTAMVSLFPAYKNETEITISATISKNINVQANDIVVILFLDTNFKTTLKQALKQQKRTTLDTTNLILHDINYGVIISSMTREYIPYEIDSITNEQIDDMFKTKGKD